MKAYSWRRLSAANPSGPARPVRIKIRAGLLAGVTTLLLLSSVEAHAGFIGQTMSASYRFPTVNDIYAAATTWTPPSFTVGPGEETVGDIEGVTQLHVDFAKNRLLITLNTSLTNPTWLVEPFNGPVFTADAPLYIAGASIDPTTTMSGFDVSRVTWTGETIRIDWNGLSYQDGTVVAVDFAVPEPMSLAIMSTGLVGLGLVRRRHAPSV